MMDMMVVVFMMIVEYEPSDLYLGLVAVLKEGLVWLK